MTFCHNFFGRNPLIQRIGDDTVDVLTNLMSIALNCPRLKYKALFTFFHELVKVGRHKSCLIDKKEQSTCQHKMQLQMITKLAYKLFYVGSYITEQLIS